MPGFPWGIRSGHRVKQTPLPPAAAGIATKLTFAGPESADTLSSPEPETHPLVLTERQAEKKIEVLETMDGPGPEYLGPAPRRRFSVSGHGRCRLRLGR